MEIKDFKKVISRYLKGTSDTIQEEQLSHFYTSLLNKNKDRVFRSDLEKLRVKKEIKKGVFDHINRKSGTDWYRIAASFIVLIGLGIGIYQFTRTEVKSIVITNDGDSIKNITLPDNTKVVLNRNSSMEFPESFDLAETRTVKLKGEAFFEVTKNKQKPFIVLSNNIATTALGTQFNVRQHTNRLDIALIEGSVEVAGLQHTDTLVPNEKAIFDIDRKELEISHFDPKLELAWKTKTFTFVQTPLRDVIKIIGRKYNIDIVLASDNLENIEITGIYDNQPLAIVLRTLSHATKLNYKMEGGKIILYQ